MVLSSEKQNIYCYLFFFNFKTERPHPGNQLSFYCMKWYSWVVIHSSHRICIRSHCICIVVKVYNHALQLQYGCIPMQYSPLSVLLPGASRKKTFIKNKKIRVSFVCSPFISDAATLQIRGRRFLTKTTSTSQFHFVHKHRLHQSLH